MENLRVRGMSRSFLAASVAAGFMLASAPAFAVGAIAVGNPGGLSADQIGYGVGHGDTREEAQRHAFKRCSRVGNSDCAVAVWYDTCGAYAASRHRYGFGYGTSEEIARSEALSHCASDHCEIVVSDCVGDR